MSSHGSELKSREMSWREGLVGEWWEGIIHDVQGWGLGLDLGNQRGQQGIKREAQPGRCLGECVGKEKYGADRERESS